MNLEKKLIEHCSPTLAGIKTANLFALKFENSNKLQKRISELNAYFTPKGISFMILKQTADFALVYVYRENMLKEDMRQNKVQELLSFYDYKTLNTKESLKRLSKRLEEYSVFPHEIGLFLGYPPEDVEGFICNEGKNCNLCGYWKVYGNTEDALIKFAKYDKCKEIYKKLWADGQDILQLAVKKQIA